jgi:L-aminoadipate-semialdehyde dehydrogenase
MFTPNSNFFEEGGHSILAQQMLFRIKKEWKDIDLPVRVVLQAQTLEALAAEIDRALDPIGLRLDAMPLIGDVHMLDEAYAADARDLVVQLPESIQHCSIKWDYATTPTVFLTGATGFLGSYILHELIEGPTKARVIALVRAKDTAGGLNRVENTAKAYGLFSPTWASSGKLDVVTGDISKPQLGVSKEVWDRLAAEVDVVIHNGAQVNWMLPYSSLRSANVLSTVSCIHLCSSQKPKRFAFVSSTSTLDSDHFVQLTQEQKISVQESDDLEGSSKGLSTGYGQSKWASEYVVREAGKRGLVGSIIRPGYVTGDAKTGVSVTDDFLVRLLKACLQVGGRPDIDNTVNAVPVSQVSRIVVAATFHLPAAIGQPLGTAQVNSHPRPTMNEWIGALEVYGYKVPKVTYEEWCAKIHEYMSKDGQEEFALLPLFHFVVGDLPDNTIAPNLDDANAAASLKEYISSLEDPLAASAVGVETLGMYLAYLVGIAFLPPPPGKGERELPKLDAEVLERLASGGLGGRSARA